MRMLYSESRFYRPEVEDSEDEGDYDGDELSETDGLLQLMDWVRDHVLQCAYIVFRKRLQLYLR